MDPKDEARVDAASTELARRIQELISEPDIHQLKHLQLLVLGRLQDSNAILSHLNDFSERSLAAVASDFSRNTRLVKSMKDDLDYIFARLRYLKSRLSVQYPNAFNPSSNNDIVDQRPDLDEPQ